ncbi:hypothetical protein BH18ACT7_BH18ACT7_12660 [soil metagenome]
MVSTFHEIERLKALRELNILDTLPEHDYDHITRMASQICHTPVAYISFIDDTREWFKSSIGIECSEISRDNEFCNLLLAQPYDCLLLPNTKKTAVSYKFPKLSQPVKFSLNIPIVTETGYVLGSLSVMDYERRILLEDQLTSIKYLASLISEKVQSRRNSKANVQGSGQRIIIPEQDPNLQELINFLPNILVRSSLAGKVLMISPASLSMLGYSPDELIGGSFARLYADEGRRQQLLAELNAKGFVNDFHARLICKNGMVKDFSITAHPYRNKQNEMIGVEGVMTDITKIMESKKEILDIKDFYEKTLNAIGADIAVLDQDNRYCFLNKHAVKNEETRKLLIGKTNTEYFQLQNSSRELALLREDALNAVVKGNNKVEWIEKYRDSNGATVHKLCIAEIFKTNDNETFKIAYGIDISKLKDTEYKLAESERYLTSLINSIPDLILRIDADGTYLDFKKENNVHSNSSRNLLGKSLFDIFGRDEAAFHLEKIRFALISNTTVTYEYSIVREGERYFEARVNKINENEVVAIIRDITERKISEKQIKDYTRLLKEREENLERLIYSAPKGIMVLNTEGKVLLWNPMCETLFCTSESQITGKYFNENFIREDEEYIFDEALAEIREHTQGSNFQKIIELNAINQSGNQLIIKITFSKSIIDDTPVFVAFISDITDQKRSELILKKRQSQLVEAQQIAKIASFEWNITTNEVQLSSNISSILGLDEGYEISCFQALLDFIHLDDIRYVREKLNVVTEAETIEPLHFRMITNQGDCKYIMATGHKPKGDKQLPPMLIGTLQDISEQKLFDQKLFKAVIESEQRERSRIAAELHDGVCQDLAAAKLGIEMAIKTCEQDSDNSKKLLGQVVEGITQALLTTSKVSHDLLPADLKHEGLAKSLENLLNKLNAIDSIRYHIEISGLIREPDPLIAINIYRIAQEFIRNTQKHSGANNLNIYLTYFNEKLQLKMKDDGKGFDMKTVKSDGIGFINLSKRIQSIGGNYSLVAKPEKGVLLSLTAPLP